MHKKVKHFMNLLIVGILSLCAAQAQTIPVAAAAVVQTASTRQTKELIYGEQLGTCQIINKDAVSGQPVEGAVYQIASLDSANQQTLTNSGAGVSNGAETGPYSVIGDFATDQNGIINISNLPKGWYTVQEVQAPYAYELDASVHNFQITGSGYPITVSFANNPITGRIAITEVSADYNKNNGYDSNMPLPGAVFNVVSPDGTVIDTIATGDDGTAATKPIRIGDYSLVEVAAPEWYSVNSTPVTVSLTRQGQIVSVTARGKSIGLGVTILKTSDSRTADWGDTVNYYITGVQNSSNVDLDNFQIHDKLPDPEAATIQYFDTGLWSQLCHFSFSYATNVNTEYIEIPGAYTANAHHQIDLSAETLGLMKGEFVTQIKMVFQETVNPGFKLLEAMSSRETVSSGNRTGYQFTNYADVTGRWQGQTVSASTHWTIEVIHRAPIAHAASSAMPSLPKTGD